MRQAKRVFVGWSALWWSRSHETPFANVFVARDPVGVPWSIGEIWRAGRRWKSRLLHPSGHYAVRSMCFDSLAEAGAWLERQWALLGGTGC